MKIKIRIKEHGVEMTQKVRSIEDAIGFLQQYTSPPPPIDEDDYCASPRQTSFVHRGETNKVGEIVQVALREFPKESDWVIRKLIWVDSEYNQIRASVIGSDSIYYECGYMWNNLRKHNHAL